MKINKKNFKKLYFDCLRDILKAQPITNVFKEKISKHDISYIDYDLENYLKKSWYRAWQVYKLLPDISANKIRILDVGGFLGNFAVCFHRLGYEVVIVDVYESYDDSFGTLKEFLISERIEVLDQDFTHSSQEKINQTFDVVICLAVLEHLADSPKVLMDNLKHFLTDSGYLILEVPNLLYWPKRINMLIGRSILPSIEVIYKSSIPFMGHHHEYTTGEIVELARLAGLKVSHLVHYNYSIDNLRGYLIYLPILICNNCKEIILIRLIK